MDTIQQTAQDCYIAAGSISTSAAGIATTRRTRRREHKQSNHNVLRVRGRHNCRRRFLSLVLPGLRVPFLWNHWRSSAGLQRCMRARGVPSCFVTPCAMRPLTRPLDIFPQSMCSASQPSRERPTSSRSSDMEGKSRVSKKMGLTLALAAMGPSGAMVTEEERWERWGGGAQRGT